MCRETRTPPLEPRLLLSQVRVEHTTLEKKKEKYSETELHDLAIHKIAEYECEVRIFFDGSTSTTQEQVGACVYIESSDGEEFCSLECPVGAYSSSFSVEAVAMLEACKWLEIKLPRNCLICTDSLSLVQALEKSNWKDPNEKLKEIKRI